MGFLQEKPKLSDVTALDEEGVGIVSRRQEDAVGGDALRPETMG